MSLDRRAFLSIVAGSPFIFGLPELLAQEAPRGPEWFRKALAAMKERKLHGVVLITPKDEAGQKLLGQQLRTLVEGESTEVHEILLTGIFIVMVPELAVEAGLKKADEKETRFLLSPDGKRIAAEEGDPKAFEKPEAFCASFEPFLNGADQERLRTRAKEIMSADLLDDVSNSLRDLGDESIEKRSKASAYLESRGSGLHPLLAWTRRTSTDAEVRGRVRSILERAYNAAKPRETGPRLPYGTRSPLFIQGCGGEMECPQEWEKDDGRDVGVDCGMGRIGDEKVVKFLRFLTK